MKLQKMAEIKGKTVDDQSRCQHWQSRQDIIAIKFACCGEYYACYSCHEEAANHPPQRWSAATFDKEKVILCGVCQYEMTMKEYQTCGSQCPKCSADFNPRCRLHWPLYFEV